MILFIPFAGILKIVSDYIPEWEALNILLGRESGNKTVRKVVVNKTLLEKDIINS
jgi:hypothetical protein